jgi:hypothetical protein
MRIPSETMRSDMADHKALLRSIDSSVGTMMTAFSGVQQNMSESVTKLEMVWREMPRALGYSWGPELPILLLDEGRKQTLDCELSGRRAAEKEAAELSNHIRIGTCT